MCVCEHTDFVGGSKKTGVYSCGKSEKDKNIRGLQDIPDNKKCIQINHHIFKC